MIGEDRDSTHRAMTPTAEQFAMDSTRDIPGGFEVLGRSGIDGIEVVVDGDAITIRFGKLRGQPGDHDQVIRRSRTRPRHIVPTRARCACC